MPREERVKTASHVCVFFMIHTVCSRLCPHDQSLIGAHLSANGHTPANERANQSRWNSQSELMIVEQHYIAYTARLVIVILAYITRRPTNWWGSAKRDVTNPTATVVYNACYYLFPKRACIPLTATTITTPSITIRLEHNHCNEK